MWPIRYLYKLYRVACNYALAKTLEAACCENIISDLSFCPHQAWRLIRTCCQSFSIREITRFSSFCCWNPHDYSLHISSANISSCLWVELTVFRLVSTTEFTSFWYLQIHVHHKYDWKTKKTFASISNHLP